jgi:hypothetical protein
VNAHAIEWRFQAAIFDAVHHLNDIVPAAKRPHGAVQTLDLSVITPAHQGVAVKTSPIQMNLLAVYNAIFDYRNAIKGLEHFIPGAYSAFLTLQVVTNLLLTPHDLGGALAVTLLCDFFATSG